MVDYNLLQLSSTRNLAHTYELSYHNCHKVRVCGFSVRGGKDVVLAEFNGFVVVDGE